jgi:nucleotide-binding universal stress UspA family protein
MSGMCEHDHNGYSFGMGSTIVCAVDSDDDGSRRPLAVGADLAERLGLPLVVAYVAPLGHFSAGGPVPASDPGVIAPAPALPYPYPIAPDAAELDKIGVEARRRVEQLLAQWGVHDAQVEVALEATAADGLRRIAVDRDAELLVVGSRGRGTVRAALLGSTSHALVSDAPCPVVVVPASE